MHCQSKGGFDLRDSVHGDSTDIFRKVTKALSHLRPARSLGVWRADGDLSRSECLQPAELGKHKLVQTETLCKCRDMSSI